jgi:HEAT repeat protein
MDLCAWQTARAIEAGRSTFERLLEDADRNVVAAAAKLLLLWRETRQVAKQTLIRTIEDESDPRKQAGQILELGVYADEDDLPTLEGWITPEQPPALRAAAALTWAWLVNPRQVSPPVLAALDDCSAPTANAFGELPWVGLYHRGPWILPANAAHIILRLAASMDKEARWRAVQGLCLGRETAKNLSGQLIVPVLMRALRDTQNRIRDAAAYALSQRGEEVVQPHHLPVLIDALVIRNASRWADRESTVPADTATWTSDFAYESSLDDGAATCGHIARLLATFSHRLDSEQRQQVVAGIQQAIRHFSGKRATVMFESMGIEAAPFLKEQLGLVRTPKEWGIQELLVPLAFSSMQDWRLSPEGCEHRLAELLEQDPEATIADAIEVVTSANHRNAALGAVHWFMSLGPAAESALPSIEAMSTGTLDPYAKDEAKRAARFIRVSLSIEPDVSKDTQARSARHRVASWLRVERPNLERPAVLSELEKLLENDDAYIRAEAANTLAKCAAALPISSSAIRALENLLTDEAAVEVGISGLFELDGRVCHWRRERRSPRASALNALLVMDCVPRGERSLRAMLAESTHAALITAHRAVPHRFPIQHWRRAASAAGGLAIAEPQIRACRQRCRELGWSGDSSAFAAQSELAVIVRQLSGRLI